MEGLDKILESIGGAPRGRGRLAKDVVCEFERELTEADLELLADAEVGALQSAAAPIKKLMHRHHTLARLLAQGNATAEISLITGYSISRISVLKSMPAVAELVEYYKSQQDEIFLDVHQRLASLGLDVVEELHQRLEENPDKLSNQQLVEVAKLALDRAGFGPVSTRKVQGAVAMLRPEDLDRLKQEVQERRNATLRQIGPPDSAESEEGTVDLVLSAEDVHGGTERGEG